MGPDSGKLETGRVSVGWCRNARCILFLDVIVTSNHGVFFPRCRCGGIVCDTISHNRDKDKRNLNRESTILSYNYPTIT